jgi:hypothetical protein
VHFAMTAQPPRHLYTADDLLAGFNPWDEMGFAPTRDFSVYRQFVTDGGPLPRTVAIRIAQAKHDAGMHFVCFSPPYNGPWWACWVVMWLASHAIWRAVAFFLSPVEVRGSWKRPILASPFHGRLIAISMTPWRFLPQQI